MIKWLSNLFNFKQEEEPILISKKLKRLIDEKGKAYVIKKKGVVLDYYPNLNQIVKKYNLKSSTLYNAINKKGTYKINDYEIEVCLKY